MNKLLKKSLLALGMAASVITFNALSEIASKSKKNDIKNDKK